MKLNNLVCISLHKTAKRAEKSLYSYVPFRERRPLALRKQEAADIRRKFPKKIPIIVEKFGKDLILPFLDKNKFLVPDDMTMSQFTTIVRNRLNIKHTQTLFLLVRNQCLTSLSRTMGEVYWEYKESDGFLYVTYTAQETYG